MESNETIRITNPSVALVSFIEKALLRKKERMDKMRQEISQLS